MAAARPGGQSKELKMEIKKPDLPGANRKARMHQLLAALPTTERDSVLCELEALTEAMTPREIENALLISGLSRSNRRKLVGALKGFQILMVSEL